MFNRKYLLSAAVFAFLITGCLNTPAIVLKAGSGDQAVTAKAGKTFSIQLESQLSTGFSWKLAELPTTLSIVKEVVTTEENDKTGGVDIQEFVFKSIKKGDLTLTFNYGEHWKKKPQFVKTSNIKVRIE